MVHKPKNHVENKDVQESPVGKKTPYEKMKDRIQECAGEIEHIFSFAESTADMLSAELPQHTIFGQKNLPRQYENSEIFSTMSVGPYLVVSLSCGNTLVYTKKKAVVTEKVKGKKVERETIELVPTENPFTNTPQFEKKFTENILKKFDGFKSPDVLYYTAGNCGKHQAEQNVETYKGPMSFIEQERDYHNNRSKAYESMQKKLLKIFKKGGIPETEITVTDPQWIEFFSSGTEYITFSKVMSNFLYYVSNQWVTGIDGDRQRGKMLPRKYHLYDKGDKWYQTIALEDVFDDYVSQLLKLIEDEEGVYITQSQSKFARYGERFLIQRRINSITGELDNLVWTVRDDEGKVLEPKDWDYRYFEDLSILDPVYKERSLNKGKTRFELYEDAIDFNGKSYEFTRKGNVMTIKENDSEKTWNVDFQTPIQDEQMFFIGSKLILVNRRKNLMSTSRILQNREGGIRSFSKPTIQKFNADFFASCPGFDKIVKDDLSILRDVHADQLGNMIFVGWDHMTVYDPTTETFIRTIPIKNASGSFDEEGNIFVLPPGENTSIQHIKTKQFGLHESLANLYNTDGSAIMSAMRDEKQRLKVRKYLQRLKEEIILPLYQSIGKSSTEESGKGFDKTSIDNFNDKLTALEEEINKAGIYQSLECLILPVEALRVQLETFKTSIEQADAAYNEYMAQYKELVETKPACKTLAEVRKDQDRIRKLNTRRNTLIQNEWQQAHKPNLQAQGESIKQARERLQAYGQKMFDKELQGIFAMQADTSSEISQMISRLESLNKHVNQFKDIASFTCVVKSQIGDEIRKEKLEITEFSQAMQALASLSEVLDAEWKKHTTEETAKTLQDNRSEMNNRCRIMYLDAKIQLTRQTKISRLKDVYDEIQDSLQNFSEEIGETPEYKEDLEILTMKTDLDADIETLNDKCHETLTQDAVDVQDKVDEIVDRLLHVIEQNFFKAQSVEDLQNRIDTNRNLQLLNDRLEILAETNPGKAKSYRKMISDIISTAKRQVEQTSKFKKTDDGCVEVGSVKLPRVTQKHDLLVEMGKGLNKGKLIVRDVVGGRRVIIDESNILKQFEDHGMSLFELETQYKSFEDFSDYNFAASEYLALASFDEEDPEAMNELFTEYTAAKNKEKFCREYLQKFLNLEGNKYEKMSLLLYVNDAASILNAYIGYLIDQKQSAERRESTAGQSFADCDLDISSIQFVEDIDGVSENREVILGKGHPLYGVENGICNMNMDDLKRRFQMFVEKKNLYKAPETEKDFQARRKFAIEIAKKALYYDETLPEHHIPKNIRVSPGVKNSLEEVARSLEPQLGSPPRSILRYTGLPGNGKSTDIAILASLMNRKFFYFNAVDFRGLDSFDLDPNDRKHALVLKKLKAAAESKNAIIFIDDFQDIPAELLRQFKAISDGRRTITITIDGEPVEFSLKEHILVIADNPQLCDEVEFTPISPELQQRMRVVNKELPSIVDENDEDIFEPFYILCAYHPLTKECADSDIEHICRVALGKEELKPEVGQLNAAQASEAVRLVEKMYIVMEEIKRVYDRFDQDRRLPKELCPAPFRFFEGFRFAIDLVELGILDDKKGKHLDMDEVRKLVQMEIIKDAESKTRLHTDIAHLHILFDTEEAPKHRIAIESVASVRKINNIMGESAGAENSGGANLAVLIPILQDLVNAVKGNGGGGNGAPATIDISPALKENGKLIQEQTKAFRSIKTGVEGVLTSFVEKFESNNGNGNGKGTSEDVGKFIAAVGQYAEANNSVATSVTALAERFTIGGESKQIAEVLQVFAKMTQTIQESIVTAGETMKSINTSNAELFRDSQKELLAKLALLVEKMDKGENIQSILGEMGDANKNLQQIAQIVSGNDSKLEALRVGFDSSKQELLEKLDGLAKKDSVEDLERVIEEAFIKPSESSFVSKVLQSQDKVTKQNEAISEALNGSLAFINRSLVTLMEKVSKLATEMLEEKELEESQKSGFSNELQQILGIIQSIQDKSQSQDIDPKLRAILNKLGGVKEQVSDTVVGVTSLEKAVNESCKIHKLRDEESDQTHKTLRGSLDSFKETVTFALNKVADSFAGLTDQVTRIQLDVKALKGEEVAAKETNPKES